ncbi:MAG: hypothetical protein EpisKO_40770 [Epibacterium sp.]
MPKVTNCGRPRQRGGGHNGDAGAVRLWNGVVRRRHKQQGGRVWGLQHQAGRKNCSGSVAPSGSMRVAEGAISTRASCSRTMKRKSEPVITIGGAKPLPANLSAEP